MVTAAFRCQFFLFWNVIFPTACSHLLHDSTCRVSYIKYHICRSEALTHWDAATEEDEAEDCVTSRRSAAHFVLSHIQAYPPAVHRLLLSALCYLHWMFYLFYLGCCDITGAHQRLTWGHFSKKCSQVWSGCRIRWRGLAHGKHINSLLKCTKKKKNPSIYYSLSHLS